MKKFFKTFAAISMIALLAANFTACSNGSSDDDDNDDSTPAQDTPINNEIKLPASIGTNELKGKTLKNDDEVTLVFKEDTYTETETKKGKRAVEEYKYSYDSNKGLITYNLLSVTIDNKKITTMKGMYAYYAKEFDMPEEAIKTLMGDIDMFSLIAKSSYYILESGDIVIGDYFTGNISLEKFLYPGDNWEIELNEGSFEWEDDDDRVEFSKDEKSFAGDLVEGTISKVTLPAKTLKELIAENPDYQGEPSEKNGYITIKFKTIPDDLAADPYNLQTSTEYKFFFNPNFDQYELQN